MWRTVTPRPRFYTARSPNKTGRGRLQGVTTLKGIEQHRLQELILKDLEIYKTSDLDGIHSRIGKEIPRRKVLYQIQKLLAGEKIEKEGYGRWTKYIYFPYQSMISI